MNSIHPDSQENMAQEPLEPNRNMGLSDSGQKRENLF